MPRKAGKRKEPENEPQTLSKKKQRQLRKEEKLKSKMASAEEEEDIPPMPDEDQHKSHWNLSSSVVTSGTVKTKAKPGKGDSQGWKVCKSGHPLTLMRTPHDEYICDGCDRGFLPLGARMYGCRLCDWDSCDLCVHPAVKQRLLTAEEKDLKAAVSSGKSMISTQGSWKYVTETDTYQNKFISLRHEGSGVIAELHHYSIAQFTFRPGPNYRVNCLSETGDVVPFQLSFPTLERDLAKGKGKPVPPKLSFGNWDFVGLEDGGAVASNNSKFVKTSKYKEKEKAMKQQNLDAEGMELHFLPTGEIVWIASEAVGNVAVIIRPLQESETTTKEEALKLLGGDDDEEEED